MCLSIAPNVKINTCELFNLLEPSKKLSSVEGEATHVEEDITTLKNALLLPLFLLKPWRLPHTLIIFVGFTETETMLLLYAGVLEYKTVKNSSTSGVVLIIWRYLLLLDSVRSCWAIWAILGTSLASGIPDIKLFSPQWMHRSSNTTSNTARSDMSTISANSALSKSNKAHQHKETTKTRAC